MTLKQGRNCGYRAQKGVIIGLYGPKTGSKTAAASSAIAGLN
jgi:hypothetical protein